MKYISKNNGFTLIEILVGINLGFLIITVVVSFFLFSTKFVVSTTKKIDQRQTVNDYLFRFGAKLRKAEQFYFQQNDSLVYCVIDNQDTVSFGKHSSSLMNLYKLDNITDYNIVFNLRSGEEAVISEGILERTFRGEQNSLIQSSEIVDMKLALHLKDQLYDFKHITPNTSINRFRNMTK